MPTPPWTYDPKAHNYRRGGRFVAFSEILKAAYQYADNSGNVVAGLGGQVSRGQLRVDHWQELMRGEIKRQHISQYMAGRGGLTQMRSRDWGILGRELRDQYHYLDGFARDIAEKGLSAQQIEARAKMYIDAAHKSYERGRSEALGLPVMPAYPGDGQTPCLTGCRCNWDYARGEGGWNATWVLDPNAKHCTDCPKRARVWNPLFVPDGMDGREQAQWRRAALAQIGG